MNNDATWNDKDGNPKTLTFTLITDKPLVIPFPTYTSSPACPNDLKYTVYVDGTESSEKWLGIDDTLKTLNIWTKDYKERGIKEIYFKA
jgi:hypothetical protein